MKTVVILSSTVFGLLCTRCFFFLYFCIVGGDGGGCPIRRVRTCHDASRVYLYTYVCTVMILRFSVVVYENMEKKNTPNRRARAGRSNTGTRSSNIWQTRAHVRHSSCCPATAAAAAAIQKSRRLASPAAADVVGTADPC